MKLLSASHVQKRNPILMAQLLWELNPSLKLLYQFLNLKESSALEALTRYPAGALCT